MTNFSSQLMFQQTLCSTVEFAFNQALAINVKGASVLQTLEEKTLTILLTELGFPLSFSINNNKVLVTGLTERSDCTINTSIKTLRELKKEQQITELIKQEKLDVQGDIKVAQQFANIAQSLEIDWQSEIAQHIGDIPTYKLSQLGKRWAKKINFATQQIQADASEWLVHEKRLVVTASQLGSFSEQVTEITKQTNTVAERIQRLAEKITPST
ncbi:MULTISPECIES: SCP2 domain-containing protein [unclassified Colwellia]|uniref:ubiquinone biosynthesis accessory factor UbiJ n=1 Tax=unclassified Colwellia TaxID=196834 RepID=UPI0015F71B38|nr:MULTISPECIES: SCP2 sterol-binding domain-containing protein [unclassified Colwellia]MBA6355269.1 SCP2 sterol-binding domain-containing protein [Colwellia sp. BRX8-3]MBA6358901.1 SCP2 sterol-binding domain-containing protein [Colwellia sp. BRX8-6]MBA6366415.1 SCP2 sterol-binding domain-containing protein [Colwellia sp. BRX8-5]MBA6374302.1 SCP2 sterol-binding domain-containing protein [Colwellia sp. BRX8-2]